ncbi:hypothetical protein [Burkholderia gladioli]|uniref:hypothetical protein n=1 Tax=Burkholderia gladioli TaxID=28095 RepID=UPI000F52A135|nr:hypothetical protein [Burkholderia gladioli]MBU9384975.1 hypothetical protein [Burkholderia gladioli]
MTKRKAKTAMGITVAELRRNDANEAYDVKIFLGPLKSWQMSLLMESGKLVDVETKRATPKTWRHFEDAILFALENCGAKKGFIVEIDNIVLRQEHK